LENFTSILNSRLLDWEKDHNILSDAQYGFRSGLSTIDAIFVLQSLINTKLGSKKKLYCCFVNYKKVFDSVNRTKLWYKLLHLGVQGNFLKIVQSLYDNVKSCVKYDGFLSE
jgi:hypothetical protein